MKPPHFASAEDLIVALSRMSLEDRMLPLRVTSVPDGIDVPILRINGDGPEGQITLTLDLDQCIGCGDLSYGKLIKTVVKNPRDIPGYLQVILYCPDCYKILQSGGADVVEAWPESHELIAEDEGWCLTSFDVDGNDTGYMRVAHIDSGPGTPFADDRRAWVHVNKLAESGSALHKLALEIKEIYNDA